MANIAAVKKQNKKTGPGPRGKAEPLDDGDALGDLFVDALLGARVGDLSAAEDFADCLLSVFNSTPNAGLDGESPDEAYKRLASRLGVLEGAGIRGAL